MKKILISAVVGALIIFVWDSISWMVLPVHHQTFMHTPGQDEILNVINENLNGSAAYMLPSADNRDVKLFDPEYEEADRKVMEENMGKPFAMIFYVKEGMSMEGSMFIIGYIIQFISVLCAAIILLAAGDKLTTFYMRWWIVMLIAVIISIQGHLMGWNWMGLPWHYVKGFIVDTLIGWGLCGAWLAYYFGRKNRTL